MLCYASPSHAALRRLKITVRRQPVTGGSRADVGSPPESGQPRMLRPWARARGPTLRLALRMLARPQCR
eukprot:8403686-Pyramimonas_sp.AAC.1